MSNTIQQHLNIKYISCFRCYKEVCTMMCQRDSLIHLGTLTVIFIIGKQVIS
jgi:hypothetical protein